MTEPHRYYGDGINQFKPIAPVAGVTDEELKFWEQVYVAYITSNMIGGGPKAAEYADSALERRRQRFGVR
jgi:hypothetical protein